MENPPDTPPVRRGETTQEAPDATARTAFEAGKSAARNRGLLLFVGIVTVVAGAAALALPLLASLTAALLVGWVLVATGAVGLFTAFRRHHGWQLAASFVLSLVSIAGGVLMLAQPVAGIFALATIIIAYFAASGVLRIWYGVRSFGDGGGWMVATGAVSLILAALLWFGLPFSAAWVPGVMLGVDLILWGAVQIALALRLGREPDGGTATA